MCRRSNKRGQQGLALRAARYAPGQPVTANVRAQVDGWRD